jgi:hypothetical protein
MSCGLCGHLKRVFGKPPFFAPTPPITHDAHLFTTNLDFHPFGMAQLIVLKCSAV